MVLPFHNFLNDRAEELSEDGNTDRIDEDSQEHPPNLLLLFILFLLIKLVVVGHSNRHNRCDNGQGGEEDEYDQVRAADAAIVSVDDFLNNLTLPFIVNELSVLLIPLNTLLDLLYLLSQAPDVLDCRLLALPGLNVEDGPKCDEKDVGVVDWSVDVAKITDNESLTLLLVVHSENQVVNE